MSTYQSPTPQWGLIIDRDADFKPYAEYPRGKTDQDVVLDMICQAASDWVQEYLQRPIAPTQFMRRFNGWSGWNGSYISLPYYPVLEITSITETHGLNGQFALVEQTPTNQPIGANQYQLNPQTGMVIRTFSGLVPRPFFPGSRNIEIHWIAGYDPIPMQAKLACLELARHWYDSTQEMPRNAVPHGERAERAFWPAVPNHVSMMLEPFFSQGIG